TFDPRQPLVRGLVRRLREDGTYQLTNLGLSEQQILQNVKRETLQLVAAADEDRGRGCE
ncbi:unnamed protein product, partial [Effrenium voratum]